MRFLFVILAIVLFSSCQEENEIRQITTESDYIKYLNAKAPKTTSKYFKLWNSKIKPDSMQLTSLGIVASQYGVYFDETGDIRYLKKAEKALERAVEIAAIGKADFLRGLARNYIAQHRFKEALELARQAREKGSGIRASQNLLFDIQMELGNYDEAEKHLDSIKNMSSFDYLIRLSKWNDHKGDLNTAIHFLEKAAVKTESSGNKGLQQWVYTNLADYYGHAGRIKDSYNHYLKALELNPKDAYAKKGIAWIVFSYERKPKKAVKILDAIIRDYQSPEVFLLRADIADYLRDKEGKQKALTSYLELARQPDYGPMYNMHNAQYYLNESDKVDWALDLAKEEVQNRATPETYDLLAYSYYKKGNISKAMNISQEFVEGKTEEPMVLLNLAELYKAAGKQEEAEKLKEILLQAIYELGPGSEQRILSL